MNSLAEKIDVQEPAVLGRSEPANDAAGSNDPGESHETKRRAKALGFITAVRTLWNGVVQLSDEERASSTGRLATRYETALRALFAVAEQAPFAAAFGLLQMRDGAGGSVAFNAGRALAWLDRAVSMRQTAAALRQLADVMDDDALHHGALAVEAGLAALKIAHPLAKHNPAFRAQVAHVLNEFRAMTNATRRMGKAQGATEKSDEPAAPAPKPEPA